jgi:diaminohydroxyphosphoribosylaminopyrimidine deaminase/5-amino-6-(5-phosphoribosylamino)uracil reductase
MRQALLLAEATARLVSPSPQVGCDPRGATAYLTVEPCSDHGRTGSCADALIAAGIARCVVATINPNPATLFETFILMQEVADRFDLRGQLCHRL